MKALVWIRLMPRPTSPYALGRAVVARLALTLSLVLALAMMFSWLGRH